MVKKEQIIDAQNNLDESPVIKLSLKKKKAKLKKLLTVLFPLHNIFETTKVIEIPD